MIVVCIGMDMFPMTKNLIFGFVASVGTTTGVMGIVIVEDKE